MADFDTLTQAVDDLLTRLTAMQMNAVPDAQSASKYAMYEAAPPFWTNQPGPIPENAVANDLTAFDLTITMRLIVAKLGHGYSGDNELASYLYGVRVVAYFKRYKLLKDAEGQAPIRFLNPRGCRISSPRGLGVTVINQSDYLSLDFSLVVPFKFTTGLRF